MSQTNEGESPAARQYRVGLEKLGAEAAERLRSVEKATEETEKSDPLNDELQAMRSVARTLEKLPPHAQSRVVSWLLSRFNEPRIGYGLAGKCTP